MVKRLPAMRKTWLRPLVREDPLKKEIATHSSTLAWKIPWTEECGRLQSPGSQRVRNGSNFAFFSFTLPTYERLWFSWVLCVVNGSPCLLLTVAYRFRITDSCGIFVCWYDRRYSISHHLWNGYEDVKLTYPLPEACHSRRYLQELNGLFIMFTHLPRSMVHKRTWPWQDGILRP